MQKILYSIEQIDDSYCKPYTEYIFLTKESAMEFAKILQEVKGIAIWEYNEHLHCYQKKEMLKK